MQLCKIHFASAKKASVQPYIFFLIFCSARRKKKLKNMTTSLFKCKGTNRKPQNVPSRECKDPLGEKCTRRNQDAAPERRASGMVLSTELQGQRARVKAGESPRDLHSSSPSATREHATTVLPKSRFKPRGGRTSGGRNHDGDLLVV